MDSECRQRVEAGGLQRMCRSLPDPLFVKEIVKGLQMRRRKPRFDHEMTVDEGRRKRRLRRWAGKLGVVLGVWLWLRRLAEERRGPLLEPGRWHWHWRRTMKAAPTLADGLRWMRPEWDRIGQEGETRLEQGFGTGPGTGSGTAAPWPLRCAVQRAKVVGKWALLQRARPLKSSFGCGRQSRARRRITARSGGVGGDSASTRRARRVEPRWAVQYARLEWHVVKDGCTCAKGSLVS